MAVVISLSFSSMYGDARKHGMLLSLPSSFLADDGVGRQLEYLGILCATSRLLFSRYVGMFCVTYM